MKFEGKVYCYDLRTRFIGMILVMLLG